MTDRNGQFTQKSPSSDLNSLEQRVKAAKSKHEKPVNDDNSGSLLGMAWRLSTELLVSVLVGAGLGYGLDKLFGTNPWILLVGLGFGFAAGIKSVLRTAEKMDEISADIPIGQDLPQDDEDDDY
ncbi:MAG: AtpZ/AtpI family protein [Litorimonas sp.]